MRSAHLAAWHVLLAEIDVRRANAAAECARSVTRWNTVSLIIEPNRFGHFCGKRPIALTVRLDWEIFDLIPTKVHCGRADVAPQLRYMPRK